MHYCNFWLIDSNTFILILLSFRVLTKDLNTFSTYSYILVLILTDFTVMTFQRYSKIFTWEVFPISLFFSSLNRPKLSTVNYVYFRDKIFYISSYTKLMGIFLDVYVNSFYMTTLPLRSETGIIVHKASNYFKDII